MKSEGAFNKFRDALASALVPGANPALAPEDRDVFVGVETLLSVYYATPVSTAATRQALAIQAFALLRRIGERGLPEERIRVYDSAWVLNADLAAEVRARASEPGTGRPGTSPTLGGDAKLLDRIRDLEHHIELLEAELEHRQSALDEKDARIEDLKQQLANAKRPLIEMKRVLSVEGVGIEDVFGIGRIGVRLVAELSDAVEAVVKGARDIALSEATKGLARAIVDRTRALLRRVAQAVAANKALSARADAFEERIEPYLDPLPDPPPLSIFRDGPEFPEMVVIPAGRFRMGSPEDEAGRFDDEGPVREVTIARPVALGRYPVTRGEYDAFCGATGRETPPGERGGERHPVVDVSWEDAVAYCVWLSERTGAEYRLPSEAEWEYACRAGTGTAYWWGPDWESGRANANGEHEGTTEVGAYGANPWKLHDMLGNVWEWVADDWHGSYDGAPADGAARVDAPRVSVPVRVVRGGSWSNGPRLLRSANRRRNSATYRNRPFGFRVARTLSR